MRVLVTGGREYSDKLRVWEILDGVHLETPISLLIHGQATGADRLAGDWAAEHGVRVSASPADWKKYGRAAGPIRNREMLDENPNLVVAFPGGKGTANMVKVARAAGLHVVIIE